jgi:DNA-binding NtrC family response regulator
MKTAMETILVIDDNKDMQFNLSNILKDEGYEVIIAGDGKRAVREIKAKSPDLILLDIRLPGTDGMKILEEAKQIDKDLIIIMLTAYGDVKDAVRAMRLGAVDYITKPFDNEEMILTVKKALQVQHLSKEVESLRKRLGENSLTEEVMGESPQINQVLRQIKIVAPTNITVILQGESGTGKELLARMIHQESPRRDKPFIAIDCGAIPDTLAESELFGYEKGAFTGADDKKEGKFEQANGGTLLLDEITNLPEATQVKLLRVIQERKLQHLGGRKDIGVNVRIIAASNINLSEAVRQGKIRNDLFHRLNEFHINVPPLRERKDDIPALAGYFLDRANHELNKKIKGFSAETMRFLINYNWPGNVREMKNLIKKAVLLTESGQIVPGSLAINNVKPKDEIKPPAPSGDMVSFEDSMKKVERELIESVLEQTGGNKIKAAGILKMDRKALYRKMKKAGM